MAEVSDELLTRLDVIMSDLEAKLLGRVIRGHLPEIKFLKRTSMRKRASVGVAEPGTSRHWRSRLGTLATEQ